MEQPDDSKVKSITFLVRSLIVITVCVIGVVVIFICNAFSQEFIREHPNAAEPHFVCGTCEDLRNEREKNINFNGHDGKALFKANCSSCHTATDKRSTGPGLKGVLGRIPGGDWKYRFVHDHDAMVEGGDAYSVALFENYKTRCTKFPQLTNDQIDAILWYAD